MQAIPTPLDCCEPCETPVTTSIPGAQGDAGDAGAAGEDGVNAFTYTTANFTMPAEGANVTVAVQNSTWLVSIQKLYVAFAGYLEVQSMPTSTSVILKNIENTAASEYLENAAPGSVIPALSKISPAGVQGPPGANPAGVLLAANNLSDLGSAATARTNLGLGTASLLASSAVLQSANNLSDLANASTARGNLGLGTAAVLNTGQVLQPANNLSDVASASTARTNLGLGSVLNGYGLLGSKTGVNLNVGATDTAVPVVASQYIVRRVVVTNASVSLSAATAGLFNAGGGAGTIAANQALSALTAALNFLDLTISSVGATDIQTAASLSFRCGTPQGVAATADVYIFGEKIA